MRRRGAWLVVAAAALTLPFVNGCDDCHGTRAVPSGGGEGRASSGADLPGAGEIGTPASADPTTEDDAGAERFVEAGDRFRDAQPKKKAGAELEGPVDAACVGGRGVELPLATAVVDERCSIGRVRAKHLRDVLERDGGSGVTLRQEAKVLADGRVLHRLVNAGSSSLTLPLSFSPTLPAFLVLAEDEGQTLYELAPPRFEVPPSNTRAHFARIVLEPGGAAVATIAIERAVASVVARRGGGDRADAGTARLGRGHYVLRDGELLPDVEAGAPARVPFDIP